MPVARTGGAPPWQSDLLYLPWQISLINNTGVYHYLVSISSDSRENHIKYRFVFPICCLVFNIKCVKEEEGEQEVATERFGIW